MRRYHEITEPKSVAFSLITIVIVVYAASILEDIIVPFIVAALFSFLLYPIYKYLRDKSVPKILAILLCIILIVAALGVIVYVAYSQIIKLGDLLPLVDQKFNLWVRKIADFLGNFGIDKDLLITEGQKYISELVKSGSSYLGATIGGTSSFLMTLFLLPLYIFLMLMYSEFLKNFAIKWLKNTGKYKIISTIQKIEQVVQSYILGLMMVIMVIGTLNSTALYVIGIEHALFFGFFAAFLAIIPYIGIAIGAALPILVALITKDSYLAVLAVAASFAIIQFLEGNFITPYIVGNQISINALVAIIALLLFGKLWGMGGMVLALPLTAILRVLFEASDRLKPWAYLLGDAENESQKKKGKH